VTGTGTTNDTSNAGLAACGTPAVTVAGTASGAAATATRSFTAIGGEEHTFPIDSEVPIDLIRQAVKEFLASGGRPSCVRWQRHPCEGFVVPQASSGRVRSAVRD
jgi:hypothetical protein